MTQAIPSRCTAGGVPEAGAPARTVRALVVDDDAGIRILVTRILTRHGFAVDAARDGADAIEKLARNRYDVVTLDLMMPRIDGQGVVKYVTEHLPALLPNVIVMTAFGASALPSVSPPVTRFIEKPFEITRLLAEASECVERNNADAST